jgi:hypothetical protein
LLSKYNTYGVIGILGKSLKARNAAGTKELETGYQKKGLAKCNLTDESRAAWARRNIGPK